ncbi:hypothetical protein P152DRAFT_476043 [Eremomyces bilateralis CBS 781.70]|uniref:Vacuolar protein sorting-associated protein 62 n=1 Tax=Eremomyces bilateralis CBS 781.70 TaxID=1392243 RepID=A0A6G1FW48_9PEZI|nr:uncharacterized protein P152DRAFT_476043 [Eremomyces bilateralis CBS 781.70]KAF1809910.1 hypothetical protein P152DRAFT_476043 [Eremomyces bilateralis CBS 781.70]
MASIDDLPEGLPKYVKDYAPIVYLHSKDPYRPSDIAAHLANTSPKHNYEPIAFSPNLETLSRLNGMGSSIYLASNDDVTTDPPWLKGAQLDANGGSLDAKTAAIIVHDRGNDEVDAFYMYFYSYNLGSMVFGQSFGSHVGDWEHSMIRFKNGKPTAVWFSQHAMGQAFTYDCLEKEGFRPVVYSSNGSHANYATKGNHDHTIPHVNLPFGFLMDQTEKGVRYDPLRSAYCYSVTFDGEVPSFASYDGATPTDWLYFTGRWGDKTYPDSDPRQRNFLRLGIRKFSDGPTGPRDKGLNRRGICPNGTSCWVRPFLMP